MEGAAREVSENVERERDCETQGSRHIQSGGSGR